MDKVEHTGDNVRIVSIKHSTGKIYIVQGYIILKDTWYGIAMYKTLTDAMMRLQKMEYFRKNHDKNKRK